MVDVAVAGIALGLVAMACIPRSPASAVINEGPGVPRGVCLRGPGAAREPGGFSVKLATGDVLESARLVLAYGISDELPAIPGLAERWGSSVLHCPYCHGY